MSLFEDCQPLKKHLLHLFDENASGGAKALKKLIIAKKEWPDNEWFTVERITFSREFVAIDYTSFCETDETIYLPIEEVQAACYPDEA